MIWLVVAVGVGWLLAWWFSASHVILENDTWWQIVAGKDILAGHWPVDNTWSWTLPRTRWMVQEPLFDIMEAWVVRWGYWGLCLLAGAFMASGMGLLWDLVRRRAGEVTGILLWSAGLFLTMDFWQARPQVADFLGLIAVLWAVDRGRYWVVPLMTAVWANLHSGAVISPLIMTVFLAAALIPGHWLERVRLRANDGKRLIAPTVATYVATLVTHNGLGIWVYTVHTIFSAAIFARYVTEWMAPSFGDLFIRTAFIVLALSVILLMMVRRDYKLSCGELCLFMVFLFQALGEARFLPYLYLVFIVMVSPLFHWEMSTSLAVKGVFVAAMLATFLFGVIKPYGMPSRNLQVEAYTDGYPVQAVNYIKQHHLGPVFNNYDWGGYLIYEGVPVYIDGRSEVYLWSKKDIFGKYLDTENVVNVDLSGANTVLDYKNNPLVQYLLATKKWKMLDSDRWAAVLERVKGSDHEPGSSSGLP